MGKFCSGACKGEWAFGGVIAACDFKKNPIVAELIHGFKYDSAQEIAKILTPLLSDTINKIQCDNAALVPVPLHKRRLSNRGFNQSLLLAHGLQRKNWIVENILQRTRYTKPQVELKQKQRLQNLAGAFCMKQNATQLDPAKTYFVLDDVCTTGTTLNECAKILKQHGAKQILGLVVCRT